MARKRKSLSRRTEGKNNANKGVESHVKVEKAQSGGKTTIAEKGHPNEVKHLSNKPSKTIAKGETIVGLAKGITHNLGNYESARIDCWISRVCEDKEEVVMDNLADLSNLIDEQIQFELDELNEYGK